MENQSVTYNVSLHTDKSVAMPGQRLAIIRFKESKAAAGEAAKAKLPSYCVSLPFPAISVQPACLQDAMVAAVCDLQDSIIRAHIVEYDGPGVVPAISADLLTADACAAWASEAATNGRLSKERVTTWFNDCLAGLLSEALIAKAGLQGEQLNVVIAQHRDFIVSLASPKASIAADNAKSLLRAVSLAGDDIIKSQLVRKLEVFANPKSVNLLGL